MLGSGFDNQNLSTEIKLGNWLAQQEKGEMG
jgi:hypothetical protein